MSVNLLVSAGVGLVRLFWPETRPGTSQGARGRTEPRLDQKRRVATNPMRLTHDMSDRMALTCDISAST